MSGDEEESLDREAFESWLAPSEALAQADPLHPLVAAEMLLSALSSGLVMGVASKLFFRKKGSTQTYDLALIPQAVWESESFGTGENFWITGHAVAFYDSESSPFVISAGNMGEWRLFDVRFPPLGLAAIFPNKKPRSDAVADTPDQPASKDSRLPPSSVSYAKWKAVFLATHGSDYTADLALRSARAMFPDNKVTREKVRELIPPQKPGKPTSRGKDGE